MRGARRKEKVYLNVYDLTPYNDYVHFAGLGAYHSGLEVYGREYSFGGHEFSSTGVFVCETKSAPGARFQQSIEVGETDLSAAEVQSLVDSMSAEWAGNSYHLLTRNCNSFTNALCKRMLNRRAPFWINRLACIGNAVQCCLPQSLGLRPPTADGVEMEDVNVPFSGHGYSLADYGEEGYAMADERSFSECPDSCEVGLSAEEHALLERRQRFVQAALKRLPAQAPEPSSVSLMVGPKGE
jgi:hypothetical protein